MRITGGAIRGRRLAKITDLTIRPTSDRVRTAIFNLLGQQLAGTNVLDLFAGTGSLGIESLSRGAVKAVFIDKSRKAVSIIKKNLEIAGYESVSLVLREELPKGLRRAQDLCHGAFDLVFIDPPYGKGYIRPTIDALLERNLLGQESTVIVESSSEANDSLPSLIPGLHLRDTRGYGSTLIGVYATGEDG